MLRRSASSASEALDPSLYEPEDCDPGTSVQITRCGVPNCGQARALAGNYCSAHAFQCVGYANDCGVRCECLGKQRVAERSACAPCTALSAASEKAGYRMHIVFFSFLRRE